MGGRDPRGPFELEPPNPDPALALTLHQGGIIDTPAGEWWGFSMQDHNSVGRLTSLSPVTWKDGWPYFGLPGNLTRTPRTWVKPDTGEPPSAATSPYDRGDDFAGPKLQRVWQWNHAPLDGQWSLTERPGSLRLHAQPAADFWRARNTLTQRAVGPQSMVTVELDGSRMQPGDTAGLGLLNLPWAWIGLVRDGAGLVLAQFDQMTGRSARAVTDGARVWLRVECDFDTEKARFSYSPDGRAYTPLGAEFTMVFQLKTFQGVRYALFHYNSAGRTGGAADFARFQVHEARPRGLTVRIPIGQRIRLSALRGGDGVAVRDGSLRSSPRESEWTVFRVVDCGRGRIALEAGAGEFVSVGGSGTADEVRMRKTQPGLEETFQWVDLGRGETLLMSLATHRYLRVPLEPGPLSADHPGAEPGGSDGAGFRWTAVEP